MFTIFFIICEKILNYGIITYIIVTMWLNGISFIFVIFIIENRIYIF